MTSGKYGTCCVLEHETYLNIWTTFPGVDNFRYRLFFDTWKIWGKHQQTKILRDKRHVCFFFCDPYELVGICGIE